jgi:hypothetical protein
MAITNYVLFQFEPERLGGLIHYFTVYPRRAAGGLCGPRRDTNRLAGSGSKRKSLARQNKSIIFSYLD